MMTQRSTLLELVVQWEEMQAAGLSVTPEELCHDVPELLEPLRSHLAALAGMAPLLRSEKTAEWGGETEARADGQTSKRPNVPGFALLEEIGRGGMGVVYKARQEGLNRIVAIKTILPRGADDAEQNKRFLREARAMGLLQHPNFVQIYEIGQADGQPFLAMEYLPGGTLDGLLDGKPIDARQAAQWCATLAEAVQAAHQAGVLHRDLKPGNVLLTADGTPKICDFGLAKYFANPADQTQTGQVFGTPSYMAPEQFTLGESAPGPAIDVYALGAILYEMLTGRPPFLSDNAVDILQMTLSQEPVPPRRIRPKTPRDLETICLKCLEKEPTRRYGSAQALADDLRCFLADRPIAARPIGPVGRSVRWARKHRSLAALIVVVVFSLVAGVVGVATFNRQLSVELAQTEAERQQVVATREKLRETVTQAVAVRIDSDLRELARVPLTVATMFEQLPAMDERALEQNLRRLLDRSPRIFGICVAMEPYQWRADREDFALYVYRSGGELRAKQLVLPEYRPHYRQWDWYRGAAGAVQGRWGEPYVGEGGDNTPMVTFSAPILRGGKQVGVVTADLAIEYFRQLRSGLDALELGTGVSHMLISPGNRVLSHSIDRYEYPSPDSDLTALPVDASFRQMLRDIRAQQYGTIGAIDFRTRRPATFLYARVRSADWVFVLVKE